MTEYWATSRKMYGRFCHTPSVLALNWFSPVQTTKTDASKKSEHYTAANGGKKCNKGEKVVTLMSKEGYLRNIRFTPYDVERALTSSSSICKQDTPQCSMRQTTLTSVSYIYNLHSGERLESTPQEGVFGLDTRIAPSKMQAHTFVGQGR